MSVHHTPGPWHTTHGYLYGPGTNRPMGSMACGIKGEANAARIVACVNACEGIEDPSVISELVSVLQSILGNECISFDDEERAEALLERLG